MSDEKRTQPPTLREALAKLIEKYEWDVQLTHDSLDGVRLRAQLYVCRDLLRVLATHEDSDGEMKSGRPQAKDIEDLDVLRVIGDLMAAEYRERPRADEYLWTMIWDINERFPGVPEKVLMAKLDALVRRGLIDGCTCGCRGDFFLLPAGRAMLATNPTPK